MTQDFKMTQLNDTTFDFTIDEENQIYDTVEGFETAINFQTFVDKRTTKQDISRPRDRQGWLGDLLTKQEGYEVGSLVYLKRQCRNTQLDKNEIASFVENAGNYLVDIGAVKNVKGEVVGDSIDILVEVDNNNVERYTRLWRNTELGVL